MINFFQKVLNSFKPKGPAESTTGTPSRPTPSKRPQGGPGTDPNRTDRQKPSGNRKHRPKNGKQERPVKRSPSKSQRKSHSQPWELSTFKVKPSEGQTRFHDFDLPLPVMHAIFDLGFQYCTPIQTEILPSTLAGKDASGRAQTGTGKTAAFLITVITRLISNPVQGRRKSGTPRVLVLAPTRELVLQIVEEAHQLAKYTPISIQPVFGGMDYEKQRRRLVKTSVDIIVATPGRLLDFQRRGDLNLKKVEILIIDEADRMLDMGFIPDVRKIVYSTPKKDRRQTLLFSATLTADVVRLASQWTRDPVSVEIEPQQIAVDTVDQIVYIVTTDEKFALLYNIIVKQDLKRVLIFCNRRDEVRRLANQLKRHGINCNELSGDVPQKKRLRRLEDFKKGRIRALVATDVAGRGIHIDSMDHVVNYTLPRDPEGYVHRIGRTGRAGAAGTSISFADEEDGFYLAPIEKFMGRELNCTQPQEEWLEKPKPVKTRSKPQSRPPKKYRSGGSRRKRPPQRRRTRSAPKKNPKPTSQ